MTETEYKYLEEKYNLMRRQINMHLNNRNIDKAMEIINEAKPVLDKITEEKIRRSKR